ncbi:hydroxyacylglutathione hydrolase [Macrolepiota fuliginosa MF-IS2]|uniref:hydroxyacylglutathione hydrolase n=1 Tax=Macrolepiota fuliginosa MF-IS2 TaxID=1400762 RepID=A0A9P5XPJ0_9AGAR|nr:hydroxyacylglutathione hydrolase [Macrolepiota fuliginosa MF-IS2]
MKVVPVPVREDNYAYLLIDEPSNKAAAVDPYDVPKVTAAADKLGVSIIAAITTHHHFDHSGGNNAKKYPGTPIYGGSHQVTAVSNIVKDKDEFKIGDNIQVKCLATPCHTQDSICYHVTDPTDASHPGGIFTGDTLFIAGCGRFFEGSADEMDRALKYLGSLPEKTIVYNGHEYTTGNLAFGRHIESNSQGIARLSELVKNNSITTGLTTIGDEKEWNVFMRLDSLIVREKTKAGPDTSDADVMNSLREQKNNYRG